MDIELRSAQLLVSGICHDLAGGISALSTGAELLGDEGGVADSNALDLIAASALQSTRRLQFLRVAFGQGGGDSQGGDAAIAMATLRDLTHGLLEGGRVSLVWADREAGVGDRLPLGAGKLLLNLCLIGSETLPRGGVLDVSAVNVEGRLGFAVIARGEGARLVDDLHQAISLNVAGQNLTPRTVHGHFSAVLAAQLGAELEIQVDEGQEVRFAALLPVLETP